MVVIHATPARRAYISRWSKRPRKNAQFRVGRSRYRSANKIDRYLCAPIEKKKPLPKSQRRRTSRSGFGGVKRNGLAETRRPRLRVPTRADKNLCEMNTWRHKTRAAGHINSSDHSLWVPTQLHCRGGRHSGNELPSPRSTPSYPLDSNLGRPAAMHHGSRLHRFCFVLEEEVSGWGAASLLLSCTPFSHWVASGWRTSAASLRPEKEQPRAIPNQRSLLVLHFFAPPKSKAREQHPYTIFPQVLSWHFFCQIFFRFCSFFLRFFVFNFSSDFFFSILLQLL